MTAVLSPRESTRLEKCEAVIEKGLQTFVEVGNALLEIRDSRLYRLGFDTFEDYCRERWQMSKRHANRLIESAEIVQNLGPIGPVPDSESVARPLTSLKLDQQRGAWEEAVKNAPNGKPTARDVRAAVDRLKFPSKSDDPPKVNFWSRIPENSDADDVQPASDEASQQKILEADLRKAALPLFEPLIAIIERYPAIQQYEVGYLLSRTLAGRNGSTKNLRVERREKNDTRRVGRGCTDQACSTQFASL